MRFAVRRLAPRFREGMSTVETIAVIGALLAGVALGSMYLGTDLTQLLAAGGATTTEPHETEPNDEAAEATAAVALPLASSQSPENEAATPEILQAELQQLRAEVERLRSATATAPTRAEGAALPPAEAASVQPASTRQRRRGLRTLAYWNQMNQVMQQEEQMRQVPPGGLTAANAADFVRRRGQAGQYAVAALAQLDIQDVDSQVVAHCRDIAAWYGRGTSLNNQADYLLNQGSAQQRRGAAGKAWSSAEKKHSHGVDQLNRRGKQLRDSMHQKYGLDFPPLR